jgi:hypothetical protein
MVKPEIYEFKKVRFKKGLKRGQARKRNGNEHNVTFF